MSEAACETYKKIFEDVEVEVVKVRKLAKEAVLAAASLADKLETHRSVLTEGLLNSK
jgi:ribosomal protein S3